MIRRAVAQACKAEARLDGKVEVNESRFGEVRNHLWGRAVQGKFVPFWLLKRRRACVRQTSAQCDAGGAAANYQAKGPAWQHDLLEWIPELCRAAH